MRAVKQIVAWGEKFYALAEDGTIWSRETDGDGPAFWEQIPGPPALHDAKRLAEKDGIFRHIEPDTDPVYGGPRSS